MKQKAKILALLAGTMAASTAFAAYNDGQISGMAFAGANTVQEGGSFGLHISGSKHCSIVLHYDSVGGGNVHLQRHISINEALPLTIQAPTTQLAHFWADTTASGKLPPGTYQLMLEAKMLYGHPPCPISSPALQLIVTPAPKPAWADLTQMANGLGVHAQNPGPNVSYNPPFPVGTPVFWQLFLAANYGKCMVDVSVTGPETFNFPGAVIDFLYKGNFTVNKPGKYIVTMATSPNAPIEQKCKGGPISHSFDVVDTKALVDAIKKMNPIGTVQPQGPTVIRKKP